MKVEYEKTIYEELVNTLEDAFLAGRKIKHIYISMTEYKLIMELYTNVRFLQSIKAKVLINNIETHLHPEEPMKVTMSYQVVQNWHDRTAKLNYVTLFVQ